MLKFAKAIALALYGIVGVTGWYQYDALLQREIINKNAQALSVNMTIDYVRSTVWFHSRGALQELRSILISDDLSKRERIETRIKNMLTQRSFIYIHDFNNLKTPIVDLGNWYRSNFDFDSFLEDIYQVVFDKDSTIDQKINNATDVMEEHQNIINRELFDSLNKIKGNLPETNSAN